MGHIAGRGRYASETYPEPRATSGTPGSDPGPIQFVYWVGTLETPPATPDGSDEAPFLTLTDAIAAGAALPDGSTIVYLLTETDYASEGPIVFSGNKFHTVRAMNGFAGLSAITSDTGDAGVALLFYDCILSGVEVSGVSSGAVVVRNTFGGNFSIGSIDVSGCATDSRITIANCFAEKLIGTAAQIGSGGTEISATDSTVTADNAGIICARLSFNNVIAGAGVEVTSSWQIFEEMTLKNCRFSSAGIVVTSASAAITADDVSLNQFFVGGFGSLVGVWAERHLDAILTGGTYTLQSTNDNASIGNGSITEAHIVKGNVIDMTITINVGGTTSFGTGETSFPPPDGLDFDPTVGGGFVNGMICKTDGSVSLVWAAIYTTGNELRFGNNLSTQAPADGDTFVISFMNVPVLHTVTP